MSQNNDNNILSKLSDAMANAVEVAGAGTVMVNGRRRLPASGIAFASDLILTANHVLERDEDIPVILPDGSEFSSRLAGRDPGSDLAVLRLEKPVAALAMPSSGEAHIGQLALALGRPSPNGIQASLGVVSAIGGPVRTGRGGLLERYIRTDAIPYPGFSGGPLVDSSGKVLGMNTSGLSRGASLVVPAGLAWQLADSLVKHGSVRRGYLGVRSQPVEVSAAQQEALGRQQEGGLLLVSVEKRSPAEAGGLMVGDILVGFDGQAVTDPDDLFALLAGDVVDRPIQLEVLRGGQSTQITVTIGERE